MGIVKSSSNNLVIRLRNFLVGELKRPVNQGKDMEPLIEHLAEEFFKNEGPYLTFEQKKQLIHDMSDELTGYEPIAPLLADPSVSEIMVNGANDVYIKVNGRFEKTLTHFRDDKHVLREIEKIIAPLGKRIDESSPIVDVRLPDGSLFHAIIPPLARNGPTITIQKFSEPSFTIYDLIRMGTLDVKMATFLKKAVEAKLTILISGETNSGKTSTLNALSSFIPKNERIVTIEDTAELKLAQEHVVSLEARPNREITIGDLVRNSLRMRPDRLIVGEIRGSGTLDLLQAMNMGQEGSLGTVCAHSPSDLLDRLAMKVRMEGTDLPDRAIREQIAGAVNLIVHQAHMKDGSRKIVRISEVVGLEGETFAFQDIFNDKEKKHIDSGKGCLSH